MYKIVFSINIFWPKFHLDVLHVVQVVSIGLGYGLEMNRCQAITLTITEADM